jgi:hypothetical protein
MSQASTWTAMSPELLKVAERAKREPDGQFHSLAHLIDELALSRAYYRQREDAAVGVDGVTQEDYGQDLVGNLRDLHERLRTKRYRHQPIRRVHIPKDNGKTRVQFPRATRLVIGFAYREDAERVLSVLPQRLQRYGLTLHPDKTRLVPFRRPSPGQQHGKGSGTFDFLGFTLYWRSNRSSGCESHRWRLPSWTP